MILRLSLYTILFYLVMLYPIFLWGGSQLVKSYTLGYFVSVVLMLSSLSLLRWSFNKKAKTFYIVVMGGMTMRFIIFAGIVFLLLRVLHWPLYGFIFSFLIFYVFLQYQEIKLINDELKQLKSAQNDTRNRSARL